jgi:hypothetical protein
MHTDTNKLISQVFRNYQNNSISLGSWLGGMCAHKGERKQLNKYEREIHMSLLHDTERFQSVKHRGHSLYIPNKTANE